MQDGPEQHKAAVPPAQDDAPTSYSRRATLILLGSIGVTLLVTGATGSRMLKRATPKPNPAPSPVPSAPISFPKRSPRRLKDLFAITSATVPNDEKALSKLDFRTNQQFTKSLPVPTTSGSFPVAGVAHSEPNNTANEEDPAMGAILDAIKAFGIATFILVGGTGLTAYLLARRFESTDVGVVQPRSSSSTNQFDSASCSSSHSCGHYAPSLCILLRKQWNHLCLNG
jgi:hypothetical protein